MPTRNLPLLALTLAQAGGAAPPTYHGPALQPESAYAARARLLDHPEETFRAAGYTPLWTASAEEAKGRLPVNCTVMPKEARVWEPWFRNELKDGAEILSTARLLQVREAVALYAYNDERVPDLVRRLPTLKSAERVPEAVRVLDAVRRDALAQVRLAEPSPPLDTILFTDMVVQFTHGSARYTQKYEKGAILAPWPSASTIWGRPDLGMQCYETSIAQKYLVLWWSKVTGRDSLFVRQGAYCVGASRRLAEEAATGPMGHDFLGLMLKVGPGTAYVFWDGVPFDQPEAIDRTRSQGAMLCGMVDRASLEYFAATYGVERHDSKSRDNAEHIGKPPKRPDGRFSDGDEQLFSVGNYVTLYEVPSGWNPYASSQDTRYRMPDGKIKAYRDIDNSQTGWRPWRQWRESNWSQIVALDKAVSAAYTR